MGTYTDGKVVVVVPPGTTIVSPILTGTPTAPTAAASTSSTQIATTAMVQGAISGYAPLASPTFTGVPAAVTASVGTNTTQLATTAFVLANAGGVPSGSIALWNGSIATIPSGYVLCNGSNSTPNLMDKFIVGAGSTYAVNATGGEATHTLTGAESGIAAHTHTVPMSAGTGGGVPYGDGANNSSQTTSTTGPTNAANAHNNLPPYYALAYIMKT